MGGGGQGCYQPWVMKSEGYDEPVKPFADHGKVDPAPHWTPHSRIDGPTPCHGHGELALMAWA